MYYDSVIKRMESITEKTERVFTLLSKSGFSKEQARVLSDLIGASAHAQEGAGSNINEIKVRVAELSGMLMVLIGLNVGTLLLVIGLYVA